MGRSRSVSHFHAQDRLIVVARMHVHNCNVDLRDQRILSGKWETPTGYGRLFADDQGRVLRMPKRTTRIRYEKEIREITPVFTVSETGKLFTRSNRATRKPAGRVFLNRRA